MKKYQSVAKANIEAEVLGNSISASGWIAWASLILGFIVIMTFLYFKYGHKVKNKVKVVYRNRKARRVTKKKK